MALSEQQLVVIEERARKALVRDWREFIGPARQDMLKLVAEVRRLRAEVEHLKEPPVVPQPDLSVTEPE